MLTLPFDALPDTPQLFRDYAANAESASTYFMGHFGGLAAYETHLHMLEQRQYPRQQLYDLLVAQNKVFRSGEAGFANLELLRKDNTMAVVTGQQVGLGTGPLYTLYKALTACSLAQWLDEQFPAYRFVPIFWMECEDHDFLEINHFSVISAQGGIADIHYAQPEEGAPRNIAPVGSLAIDERIAESFAALRDALPRTEFTDEALRIAEHAYAAGITPQVAFARMMNALYPDAGLIFLDPTDTAFKRLAAPVLLQEIATHPVTGEEVIKRSAELEERYHAQIKPRAVNLFLLHKDGRYPIEPYDGGFFLKGTRQRFTREEMVELAEREPERFSPNVLLRPITQDFVLPTTAYVAGPSEVSYFAQLQPAYDHFRVPMPVIVPRASISIVERHIDKVFAKYDLPYAAAFLDIEAMHRIAATDKPDEGTRLDLAALREGLRATLEDLAATAAAEDANLADPAAATAKSIDRAFDTFEEKVLASRRRRDEVMMRQLEKLALTLFPDGAPQERRINILSLLNKYGPDVLRRIQALCTPFPAEHRLLLLGKED